MIINCNPKYVIRVYFTIYKAPIEEIAKMQYKYLHVPIGNSTGCTVILIGQHENDQFSYCCLLVICTNRQHIFCFSLFYYIVIALLIFIAVSIVWSFSVGRCRRQWQESCSPELLIYVEVYLSKRSQRDLSSVVSSLFSTFQLILYIIMSEYSWHLPDVL